MNASQLLADGTADATLLQRARSIEASARKALNFVERHLDRRASIELRRGFIAQSCGATELLERVVGEFAAQAERDGLTLCLRGDATARITCDGDSAMTTWLHMWHGASALALPEHAQRAAAAL